MVSATAGEKGVTDSERAEESELDREFRQRPLVSWTAPGLDQRLGVSPGFPNVKYSNQG